MKGLDLLFLQIEIYRLVRLIWTISFGSLMLEFVTALSRRCSGSAELGMNLFPFFC